MSLGETYFVTSSRMNLGLYQPDGVICDLAPHDLSILLYCLDEKVVSVSASGRSVFNDDVPETAFLTLTFASGTTANIQVSWLAPRKVRQMIVVGSKRMVLYDDTSGRRGDPRLRPGPRPRAPGDLRRVPADLQDRRHGRPSPRGEGAAGGRAGRLRERHPDRRGAALERQARLRDRQGDRGGGDLLEAGGVPVDIEPTEVSKALNSSNFGERIVLSVES